MRRVLTDTEIEALLTEEKQLPSGWKEKLHCRPKSHVRFTQAELTVTGSAGHEFRIMIRQSLENALDFSVVLLFIDEDGQSYRLIRFNGRHPSQHTNKWEKRRKLPNAKFRNEFHIHRATERYQLEGYEIDGFAEPTTRFSSLESALQEFVASFGFEAPDNSLPDQRRLPFGADETP